VSKYALDARQRSYQQNYLGSDRNVYFEKRSSAFIGQVRVKERLGGEREILVFPASLLSFETGVRLSVL
jgi:hypothetical protein